MPTEEQGQKIETFGSDYTASVFDMLSLENQKLKKDKMKYLAALGLLCKCAVQLDADRRARTKNRDLWWQLHKRLY